MELGSQSYRCRGQIFITTSVSIINYGIAPSDEQRGLRPNQLQRVYEFDADTSLLQSSLPPSLPTLENRTDFLEQRLPSVESLAMLVHKLSERCT